MIVQRLNDRIVVQAPAKVNLHLEVLGRRPDGYHELETLMVAIDVFDTLEFAARPDGTEVRSSDPSLATGEDNLVNRAVDLVRRETGITTGISIDLTKRIPMAAGLAGGSSDAAATLFGLNRYWHLDWTASRLAELGARLGSDVPFFFSTPAAVCRGLGEKVTPCRPGAVLHLVLVRPEEGLSTAAVFRSLNMTSAPKPIEPIVSALEEGDAPAIASMLFNRLEEASFQLSPAVAALRRDAEGWGCLGSLMTGSGSTVFAVCETQERAVALGRRLSDRGIGRVFVVQTSL